MGWLAVLPDQGAPPSSQLDRREVIPDRRDVIPDFDALYRADPDPWEVGTSWYERRKIAVVLSCLRRERYAMAWDVACGTGHLAARLGNRCEMVFATDAAPAAVAGAAARTADRAAVRCAVSALPAAPDGIDRERRPDLIVLSEVLYYLDQAARAATYDLLDSVTTPDADVVGVHWRPQADDFRLPGANAHRELGDALVDRGWSRVVTHTDEEFLVGVWSRALTERIGRP